MITIALGDISRSGDHENDVQCLPTALLKAFVKGHKILWDSRDKGGDCRLIVAYPATSTDVPKDDGEVMMVEAAEVPSNHTATYMCHSAMLIAHSDYFRTRLQDCGGASSSATTDHNGQQLQYADERKGGVVYLNERLDSEGDLPVFEAMLRYLYLAEIDPALSVLQLVKLIELTDRFSADNCRAASLHVLAAMISAWDPNADPASRIQQKAINLVYKLEPANRVGWEAFECAVHGYLLRKFQEPGRIYSSMLPDWVELPWAAVRVILSSKDICLDDEDLVACLVRSWVMSSPEMKDTNSKYYLDVITDIETNIIHFGFLDPSFCGWFLKEEWLSLAPAHQGEIFEMITTPKGMPITWGANLPPLWYTPREGGYYNPDDFCFDVSQKDFEDSVRVSLRSSENKEIEEKLAYHSKGWVLTIMLYISSGNVSLKAKATRPYTESKALLNTRILTRHGTLVLEVPYLDMSVKDTRGYTPVACVMQAAVASMPESFFSYGSFNDGYFRISVVVESIY